MEIQEWVRKGGKEGTGKKKTWERERESVQERLSIFRLWVQSARLVIISKFRVFWMDQCRARWPRAQGLWFTMETVYYSGRACLWGVHLSGVVFWRARPRQKHEKRTKGWKEQRKSEMRERCTFWVFLQERFGGVKERILTHSCLGLHSQPFFSSARRHSDLLVHLQKKKVHTATLSQGFKPRKK